MEDGEAAKKRNKQNPLYFSISFVVYVLIYLLGMAERDNRADQVEIQNQKWCVDLPNRWQGLPEPSSIASQGKY